MEKAFRWAEAADPQAKLFINEFAIDFLPDKLDDILEVADGLRAIGCKVDGIGFQGHFFVPLLQGDYAAVKQVYKTAADHGYLIHLSELDIAVNLFGLTPAQSDLQHRIQRKRYNDIARAYIDGVPADQRWGITLWNIADRNSFFNVLQIWFDVRFLGGPDYPLLWDSHYEAKPAYFGFRNALRGIAENWLFPNIWDMERVSADKRVLIQTARGQITEEAEWRFYLEESEKMLKDQRVLYLE
jgi:endo-1,4-beta-xylanase